MLTALYYPHIAMSEGLLKNALFLWDQLDFLAPYSSFESQEHYKDERLQEAASLITRPCAPSTRQYDESHEAVCDFLSLPLPPWFHVADVPDAQRYWFYPEKHARRTWEALEDKGLAEYRNDRYETSAAIGLAIQSIMADTCAGSERRLVTDEVDSYTALGSYLLTIGGGELGKYDSASDRLVAISLSIMNLENVSIERLISLRKKETRDPSIRMLRHAYLARIQETSDKLLEAKSAEDAKELERIYDQKMADDFKLLKDELKDEAKKVVFSKEIATAGIALAGSFFEPTMGMIVAGGALYKKKVEYKIARNRVLQGHPMSWLYKIKKFQTY